ncbi:MAG: NAD(P)/FAD-dependent oxidoreductase [Hyphomicrobiaceae bacterium]
MPRYDAIVVGAGHNGLVCANYLGKAGLKVLVLERRPIAGGATVTEEVWPGYKISVASYVMTLLQPKIMIDLDLRRHGVEALDVGPSFQPFEDGRSLVFWSDQARMIEEIRTFSAADAEAYPKFVAHMDKVIPYLRRLLFETPVDPTTGRIKDIGKAMSLAWRFRDIGGHLYDVWDLLTLSAHDYLKRWFESDQVLTAYGSYASGAAGLISPKTQGSAYVLARPLLRDPHTPAGPGGLIRGGMGSITKALLAVASELGVEVRTNTPVAKIDVENGRSSGVILESGERIAASVVAANLQAKLLYLNLIDSTWLNDEIIAAVKKSRTDSIAFKINLAASALPRWTAYDARRLNEPNPGSITLAENSDELEDAFHSARNGEMAKRPYLWITTPSAFDPEIAPPGQHVINVMGGHVPYKLKGREWDEAAKQDLVRIVLDQICRYAPGFDKHVTHVQVLTPPDIEKMFALPGGHVHHGEMSLDQIFFRRPIAHYADYRTPVTSLYLCGASAHPGGGVSGVPGHNAAREILKDLGKKMPSSATRI